MGDETEVEIFLSDTRTGELLLNEAYRGEPLALMPNLVRGVAEASSLSLSEEQLAELQTDRTVHPEALKKLVEVRRLRCA